MNAIVIGHGVMGRYHARILRDLGYTVATIDPDPAARADHAFLTRQLSRAADVAAIATPPEHLPHYARQLARPDLRLLVEKPAATSLDQLEHLAEDLAGLPVAVGLVERFNPKTRELADLIPTIGTPASATFIRWSPRPSWNVDMDLRIHDVDLAHHLGLECPVYYDTRTGVPLRREVTVTGTNGRVHVDLCDHTQSPLHALWHAFLSCRAYPTLQDAIRAHRALPNRFEALAA